MDLLTRLERLPVSRFHYRLLLLVGVGWLFDAMDTGLIGFVLAALGKDWALSPAAMGYIVSIGFVGMAIGAMLSGFFADRFGRKGVFVATLVLYSVATALCGLAWDLTSLLVLRFFVGFGLGGQLPVAVTLVSEYVPAKVRGRFIVLLESFWAVGWLAAALIAYFFIPRYGWPMAFFIGGLPILYVFFLYKRLPESVPYLIAHNRIDEAQALVSKLERESGIEPANEAIIPEQKVLRKVHLRELWQGRFAKRTLMLWLIWFGIVYSYYGVFVWLPKLMTDQGYDIIKTFEYILMMTLAQFPGYFSAAWLVEKIGRKATLSSYIALCAVCAYFFGLADTVPQLLLWGSLLSFFNLGAWGVLYTYTPELYPAEFRAFGSGWAAAVGRMGGIVAPLIVPIVMAQSNGYTKVFAMFTAVLLAVALVIVLLGEETKGRTLQEINR
ncbi:MAG: MFS transporter [Neisseria sp.]|nr:MFS transporter [Neisseria sp.]